MKSEEYAEKRLNPSECFIIILLKTYILVQIRFCVD